jgi:hypothetical protein
MKFDINNLTCSENIRKNVKNFLILNKLSTTYMLVNTEDDSDVLLEWWRSPYKFSAYIGENSIYMIKIKNTSEMWEYEQKLIENNNNYNNGN